LQLTTLKILVETKALFAFFVLLIAKNAILKKAHLFYSNPKQFIFDLILDNNN